MTIRRAIPFMLVAMLLSPGGTAVADIGAHDIEVLSRKLIEPLAVGQVQRHFLAVHVRRTSYHAQPVNAQETQLTYVYSAQLPDGSFTEVPDAYDVTLVEEHAQRGKYDNLTVYSVRRYRAADELLQVGVTPKDEVVLLGRPKDTTKDKPKE